MKLKIENVSFYSLVKRVQWDISVRDIECSLYASRAHCHPLIQTV